MKQQLFTINMLNEGLHIADVGAVILLRPTESPIIFYQQIGRCLQVDVEKTQKLLIGFMFGRFHFIASTLPGLILSHNQTFYLILRWLT
ncbi:hypothetical protein QUF74_01190 [Candidatus Halobeggiatoa sp. HSG11]|nr:hypothetical protein [Candidatus Halobeggiatoa sp. HSG11]